MANLFRIIKTSLTASDFITKRTGEKSSSIISNEYFGIIISGNTYSESTILSSNNTLDNYSELIITENIYLSFNGTIVNTSIADLIAVANFSSDIQINAINNLISEVSSSLSLNSALTNIGNIDVNNTITISSDSAIIPLLELIINQGIEVSIDSQLASISILDAQNNIGLQTDNVFVGASSLIINSIAILQSDSVIVNSNNVSMSEALNFTTDSSLLDNNISSLVNDIVYLIDGQVSFTYDGFAEIVAQLIALSQLNISNTADILSQIELQIDNQVVFDLFMEAYSIINLSGETATTFDIVSVINTVFDLNISSDILIEIASVINNNVTFSISTGIEAIDELSLSSNTYFENTILNIIVSISFIDGLGIQIQGLKIIGALFLKNINTIK